MTALRRSRLILAATIFTLAALPLHTRSAQLGSSSVEGLVVKLGSSDPVPGAVVELSWRLAGSPPQAAPQVQTMVTGDDGRFAFRNLQATEYRLVATRPGGTYTPAQYGQRDPRSQGTPLSLAAGEALKDVRLEMALTSAITGRVFDRNGEPIAYARVLAMQHWYHEGNRLLDFVQVVHTNDRGEYRLFWLPPGRYYVAARPEALPAIAGATTFVNTPDRIALYHEEVSTIPPIGRTIRDNEVVAETYELTFYGGETNPMRAQGIDLQPGITVAGIDVSLATGTVRPRKIQGVVIDGSTGQPAAGATISALPRIFAASRVAPGGTADSNGRFTIRGLTSESYILHFRTTGNLFGFLRLESGTADIDNLSLVAKPGIPLNGKVSFDGRAQTDNDPDLPRLQVQIVQDPGIPGVPTPPPVNPRPDGMFTIPSLFPAGWDFEVYIGGTRPPGTYVKSIKLGSQDVLNAKYYPEPGESQRGGLQVSGPPDQPLEIVLGIGTGTVEGQVFDSKQQIARYRTVVLLPDVPLRHRFDLHRVTATDTSGRFRFQNVTPGLYKIFAWDRIETGGWEDATLMLGYEGGGQTLRVQENGRQTIELRLIP